MNHWKDSRVFKPSCKSFGRYPILFLYEGKIFMGIGDWMPKDGYQDGEWQKTQCTNGNPLQGEVLYWSPYLDFPEHLKK